MTEQDESKPGVPGPPAPLLSVSLGAKVKVASLSVVIKNKIDKLIREKQIIYDNSDNADDPHMVACKKIHDIEMASDNFDSIMSELKDALAQMQSRLREIKSELNDDYDTSSETCHLYRMVEELI